MMVVAAAGLALANAAGIVAGAVEHRYVLQVPDGGGGKLAAVERAARSVPGVASVAAVPEAEMRQTLEKWLGPGGWVRNCPCRPWFISSWLRPLIRRRWALCLVGPFPVRASSRSRRRFSRCSPRCVRYAGCPWRSYS
ncbi:hypothetical protein [Sphingomonas sediminicola]|nr:hypothetical protein [Sphingomonas sediminicola]